MAKDPTNFRNRFKLYKEGKMPYENGLPKYAEGTEGWLPDYTMDYILALENPTKLGLVNGIWRPPTDSSKWDINAIGGGLDIRYKNNPLVYNFLSDNNRLNNPYLTEQEEYDLRKRTFNDTMLPALIRMHDKYGELISSKGYARLAGMKWLGHPFLMAITPDSITGRAFLNAIESGDRDLDTVFDAYYRHPANAKKYAARIQSDENYWGNNHSINLDDVPIQSTLHPIVEKRDAVTVRKTIPKAKTRARWTGAENVSPYLTGKPILKLKKEIKFPTAAEMHKESLWKPKFKDGKLPGYDDGKTNADDLHENERYMMEHSSLSTIDKILTSISSYIMGKARYYGAGVNNTEDAVNLRREVGGGTAQRTFLLPRSIQKRVFEDDGYIEGVPGDYGLVKSAVGNRNLPVYQTRKDGISREKLTHLWNILDHGYDTTYIDPEIQLVHAGSFPSAIYVDGTTGDLYLKAWDLNDYGKSKGGTAYEGILQAGAELLDKVGNPVVVTTGYQPMYNEYGLRRNITDKLNQDSYRERPLYLAIQKGLEEKGLHLQELNGNLVPMLSGIDVVFDRNTGKTSTYADGKLPGYADGKIHIKPSKRGTFTAAAKKHGASVREFESRVLKNPEKYSTAMVKKARFSRNARSWKH